MADGAGSINGENGQPVKDSKAGVNVTAHSVPPNGDVNEVDFKKVSIEEAFRILKSGPHGITSDDARRRIEEFGPNKLPEETRNPVLVFLGYMWNPLSWAMEVAAIISIALLDYADFALILTLLLANATISFVEESSADKAIKALAQALAPKAKVFRDGQLSSMEASELVPGDVVLCAIGNVFPADVKILGEAGDDPMQVDQAALTGESLPAKKFTGDVAFSGSTVKQGERHCLVYATGVNTFFGRAALLLGGTQNVANIQKIMTRIGAVCLVTIGIWVIIELAVQFGHYHHSCNAGEGGCPTLLNMLVVVVGGIPIAMPVVLSVTLALGASKLAEEGAIVARMSAVEEMAGMDVLCSDKTGTLTLNKLSVDPHLVWPQSGYSVDEVLKLGALSANIVSEEPIDMVMHESYPGRDTLWQEYELVKFVPFNPTDKYTIASVRDRKTGEAFRVMKGAPQIVQRNAHNADELAKTVNEKITEYANRGFRALGIAYAKGDGKDEAPGTKPKWIFVGLVPLFDPPRHDTKDTIDRCLEKGISVKMITGDQLLIGVETAKQLGMGTKFYQSETLIKAKEGDPAAVTKLVEEADGFAEVFPEHKYEIVEILQNNGHLCGMTGDGVNDAPALKKADVGIAVAGATDAARGAADIVLTNPGLSTIVNAVIGARKIFQRMTTYAKYTVAMTFRIAFTFGLLTTIYNWYFPTLLIVLLALFNDGAMIALSKDRVVPSHTPNSWNLRDIFITGVAYGLYLTFMTWLLYFLVAKTSFFANQINMYSLNNKNNVVEGWCNDFFRANNYDALASACTIPQYAVQPEVFADGGWCRRTTVLAQCMTEQKYVRNSMQRSLIYNYVSISGQSLVFVVRTLKWSPISRAGLWTYIAFFGAQFAATLISIFGFNGYVHPNNGGSLINCVFCSLSTGSSIPFFPSKRVPLAGTEGFYTDSVIGCTYYVILAWIWAFLTYLALDPIKWIMAYILNEDGFRDRATFHKHRKEENKVVQEQKRLSMEAPIQRVSITQGLARASQRAAAAFTGAPVPVPDEVAPPPPAVPGMGPVSVSNPLGRASLTKPVTPADLERASVVRVPFAGRSSIHEERVNPKEYV